MLLRSGAAYHKKSLRFISKAMGLELNLMTIYQES